MVAATHRQSDQLFSAVTQWMMNVGGGRSDEESMVNTFSVEKHSNLKQMMKYPCALKCRRRQRQRRRKKRIYLILEFYTLLRLCLRLSLFGMKVN